MFLYTPRSKLCHVFYEVSFATIRQKSISLRFSKKIDVSVSSIVRSGWYTKYV